MRPIASRADAGDGAAPGDEALQQAAQWFVLLASGEASAADHRRWQDWRAADPLHEQAWQRADTLFGRFKAIPPPLDRVSLAALSDRHPPKSPDRRRALKQLAVLFSTGLAVWGGYRGYRRLDWSADAVTAVGEQRDLILADGSRMTLDTDSAVDIFFDAEQRLIQLRRGRVLIETAADTEPVRRPFNVATREGLVIALGTRFTVQQEEGATRVTVLEARVNIRPLAAPERSVILSAGEAARFRHDAIEARATANPGDAAWVAGILVANDMRLIDLAAVLARYRAAPLVCDPRVADLRISGAFPLRDADRALAAVATTLPVQVERDDKAGIRIRPK